MNHLFVSREEISVGGGTRVSTAGVKTLLLSGDHLFFFLGFCLSRYSSSRLLVLGVLCLNEATFVSE